MAAMVVKELKNIFIEYVIVIPRPIRDYGI